MFQWLNPFPILCNYYITTRCNAKCSFCDIYRKKKIDANLLQIETNLYDLKRLGITFIDFTGGEPLLHSDLPKILAKAKTMGFRTTITTNCILYPKMAKEIIGLIDLLHFSLDSINPSVHNKIRGVNCYQQVLKSIDIARQLNERPDILFTVTDQNIDQLPKLVKFAQTNQLMLLVNPVFEYFQNKKPLQKTLDIICDYTADPFVYINRGILRFMKKNGNDITNSRCRAVTTTIVISPDNKLLLPCYHRQHTQIPIQNNLYQLYRSKKIQNYKKMDGRFPFCQHCSISCYFDPSFAYGIDDYFLLSQLSKIKYGWDKYVRSWRQK